MVGTWSESVGKWSESNCTHFFQGFVHQVATTTGYVHVDYVISYKVEFSYGLDYWVTYADGSVNSTAKGYTVLIYPVT